MSHADVTVLGLRSPSCSCRAGDIGSVGVGVGPLLAWLVFVVPGRL